MKRFKTIDQVRNEKDQVRALEAAKGAARNMGSDHFIEEEEGEDALDILYRLWYGFTEGTAMDENEALDSVMMEFTDAWHRYGKPDVDEFKPYDYFVV